MGRGPRLCLLLLTPAKNPAPLKNYLKTQKVIASAARQSHSTNDYSLFTNDYFACQACPVGIQRGSGVIPAKAGIYFLLTAKAGVSIIWYMKVNLQILTWLCCD